MFRFDRGDDAFDDLMDSLRLPLAGEQLYHKVLAHKHVSLADFTSDVKAAFKGPQAEQMARTVLVGEEYNCIALADASKRWLAIEAPRIMDEPADDGGACINVSDDLAAFLLTECASADEFGYELTLVIALTSLRDLSAAALHTATGNPNAEAAILETELRQLIDTYDSACLVKSLIQV